MEVRASASAGRPALALAVLVCCLAVAHALSTGTTSEDATLADLPRICIPSELPEGSSNCEGATASAGGLEAAADDASQEYEDAEAEGGENEWAAAGYDDVVLHGGWNLTWELYDRATKHPNATVVSWASPRAVLIRDFLAPDEVEHLIQAAEGAFERSLVLSDENEGPNDVRTSHGAWLMDERRDAKVIEIEQRIHDLAGVPHPFGEALHVLKYELGQQYMAHPDYCAIEMGGVMMEGDEGCPPFLESGGGPQCGPGFGGVTCGDRMVTVIMYLRSPEQGGATAFPYANNYRVLERPAADPEPQPEFVVDGQGVKVEVHEACKEGADALKVSPPPGSAMLFWDYVPANAHLEAGDLLAPDPYSEHIGCPVLAGTKLIATRWIRSTEFN